MLVGLAWPGSTLSRSSPQAWPERSRWSLEAFRAPRLLASQSQAAQQPNRKQIQHLIPTCQQCQQCKANPSRPSPNLALILSGSQNSPSSGPVAEATPSFHEHARMPSGRWLASHFPDPTALLQLYRGLSLSFAREVLPHRHDHAPVPGPTQKKIISRQELLEHSNV